MKLEDVTAEWVDSVCGAVDGHHEHNTFTAFNTFDYIIVKDITQTDYLHKMQMLVGGDEGSRHKPIEVLIFGCRKGEFITCDNQGYGSCKYRDVTKAFNQIIFPSQGIDDIIMEIAFYSSLTREETVDKYGKNLMTLLKVLQKEREKFLGGVL